MTTENKNLKISNSNKKHIAMRNFKKARKYNDVFTSEIELHLLNFVEKSKIKVNNSFITNKSNNHGYFINSHENNNVVYKTTYLKQNKKAPQNGSLKNSVLTVFKNNTDKTCLVIYKACRLDRLHNKGKYGNNSRKFDSLEAIIKNALNDGLTKNQIIKVLSDDFNNKFKNINHVLLLASDKLDDKSFNNALYNGIYKACFKRVNNILNQEV